MWFRHRAWIPIAWVLSLINFAGVWLAARDGEPGHGTIHASLAILFALGAQRLRAHEVQAQIAVTEPEPVVPAEPRHRLECVPGLVIEFYQLATHEKASPFCVFG